MSLSRIIFGREPIGHANKKGQPTEVDRPKENNMLNVVDRIVGSNTAPQSRDIINSDAEEAERWFTECVRRSQRGPFAEIFDLTPARAAVLLENNPSNRDATALAIDRICTEIVAGQWALNGETIIIAKTGEVNNGQTRCHAVLKAGKSIPTFIAFGLERETRLTVDKGRRRSVAHYLKMKGFSNVNALAAVASNIWQYRNYGRLSTSGAEKPTESNAMLVIEHYKSVPDSLAFVERSGTRKVCSPAILAFCHWAIRHYSNEAAADAFINRLIDGENLRKGDAVLYCRNRLLDNKGLTRPGDKVELIFRAYNYERRGDRCNKIQIMGGKLPDLEK